MAVVSLISFPFLSRFEVAGTDGICLKGYYSYAFACIVYEGGLPSSYVTAFLCSTAFPFVVMLLLSFLDLSLELP
jgi:hypothetical protein